MTSKQVHDDNEVMSNTMYKLLKKYQAIKQIVKTLHVSKVCSCIFSKSCKNLRNKKTYVGHN